MFPLVSAATIVPVLYIGFLGQNSYAALLIGGFFLGIGGTAFAVGVRFVNAWFPPERRGLAVGVFGAGMGGTAISALTTVKLYTGVGERAPFLITAALLAVYAVGSWLVMRDAPGRPAPSGSLMSRLVANARLPISWQACILYAVAFGGYVAFSVYLPVLPQDRLRAQRGRRREPNGRFRHRGRADAADRRLALRPVRRGTGPGRRVRGRSVQRSRQPHRCSSTSAPRHSWPWPPPWVLAAAPRSR